MSIWEAQSGVVLSCFALFCFGFSVSSFSLEDSQGWGWIWEDREVSVSRAHYVRLPSAEEKHYVGKRIRKSTKKKEEKLRIALRLTECDSLLLSAAMPSPSTGASGF